MSGEKAKEPSISEKISVKEQKGLNTRTLILSVLIGLVLVGSVSGSIYFYSKYKAATNILGKSTKNNSSEVEALLKKVGALMELPAGESPQIATVSDISKLKNQPFFAKAKNGDKVLIYTKSKKAILYNPTDNKIIEVETINIGPTSQNTASSSAAPTPAAVKVVILNGTKTVGLATTMEKSLTSASKNIVVVSKGNATGTYEKTVVVDLTGKNAQSAGQIAGIAKGEVGKLPTGEIKPTNADILIILGGK